MTVATTTPVPGQNTGSRQLISLPFMLLRGVSTAGVMIAAMIQIYVFARITSPEKFSIFILVGTAGYTLWLADFGVVKYLFVRLRASRLSGVRDPDLVKQSTLIVVFYACLVLAGAALCFAVLAGVAAVGVADAGYYALFFTFTALNLVWFALRNISIAVDDYIYFECIEAIRRFASIGLMLAMLAGFPLLAFLVAVNLLWLAVLAISMTRLRRKNALTSELGGSLRSLWSFYRDNRRDLVRSGTSSTSDYYIEHLPYLVVPLTFGLGAPTVILDAIFKFFRGANLFYSAVCELVLPRQTSAFAERDAPTLIRATLLAFILGLGPTLAVCGLLIVAAEPFFRILLGPAAVMPPEAAWIIVVLLIGNLVVTVSHSLLIHTGFFQITARLMFLIAVGVTAVGAVSLLGSPTIVSFMAAYAAVYICGALLLTLLAVSGPIRIARQG